LQGIAEPAGAVGQSVVPRLHRNDRTARWRGAIPVVQRTWSGAWWKDDLVRFEGTGVTADQFRGYPQEHVLWKDRFRTLHRRSHVLRIERPRWDQQFRLRLCNLSRSGATSVQLGYRWQLLCACVVQLGIRAYTGLRARRETVRRCGPWPRELSGKKRGCRAAELPEHDHRHELQHTL